MVCDDAQVFTVEVVPFILFEFFLVGSLLPTHPRSPSDGVRLARRASDQYPYVSHPLRLFDPPSRLFPRVFAELKLTGFRFRFRHFLGIILEECIAVNFSPEILIILIRHVFSGELPEEAS